MFTKINKVTFIVSTKFANQNLKKIYEIIIKNMLGYAKPQPAGCIMQEGKCKHTG